MVYCTRCGTQNPDTATNCSNCGAPLYSTTGTTSQDRHYYRYHYRRYDQDYSPRRGSGIGLLIAGLIIIIVGLALFFGQIGLFLAYFWPIVIVIIGIWLLIRGLLWSQRRYRQSPSP